MNMIYTTNFESIVQLKSMKILITCYNTTEIKPTKAYEHMNIERWKSDIWLELVVHYLIITYISNDKIAIDYEIYDQYKIFGRIKNRFWVKLAICL